MPFSLIIFIYCIVAYGISNIVVFGHGPWNLIDKLREYFLEKSPNFLGPMMSCMMCFPTNLGFVLSLINWFFLPICITPGCFLLSQYSSLWWVAMLLDGFFTSGIVWLIHHVEEWFENNSGETQFETDEEVVDKIN